MNRDTELGVASTTPRRRRGLVVSLALAAACAATVAAPAPASAAGTHCPGTFTVLHNDRIGDLRLPAGRYEITVKTPTTLGCADASQLFSSFLRHPDGNLPGGWRANAKRSNFARGSGASRQKFSVRKAGSNPGGGGGGGGGGGNSGRTTCPKFEVLHNDRVGRLRIPKGNYVLTAKRMGCPAAADQFRRFLQIPSGNLPDGWQVKPGKAKFRNPRTGESFRIKRAQAG